MKDFEVKCVIFAHETEIAARKALEASWIHSTNPSMNNKNECLSLTSELLPLISMCESSVAKIRSSSGDHSHSSPMQP